MRAALAVLMAQGALLAANAWADDPVQSWEFKGQLEAAATVEVQSRISGYLTSMELKEGAAVKKGDILVQISPRPYQLDLDAAKARVKTAEAKLETAKITRENSRKLAQNKVVSPDQLAIHAAAQEEAEAGLAAANVELERAELNLAATEVRTPIDGRISRLNVTEGNLVAADKTVLLKVVSTNSLFVAFNVPETILLRLRRARLADPDKLQVAVALADEEDYSHEAKLELIPAEANPTTGAVRFRATIENPEELLSPGMSARVRVTPSAP